MTHEEQRRYLIRELLSEDTQYQGIMIPEDAQGQKDLLRALMNMRPPMPIDQGFLTVQDEYLSAERDMAGVVGIHSLPPLPRDGRLVCFFYTSPSPPDREKTLLSAFAF